MSVHAVPSQQPLSATRSNASAMAFGFDVWASLVSCPSFSLNLQYHHSITHFRTGMYKNGMECILPKPECSPILVPAQPHAHPGQYILEQEYLFHLNPFSSNENAFPSTTLKIRIPCPQKT
jgi:hypothetical protein